MEKAASDPRERPTFNSQRATSNVQRSTLGVGRPTFLRVRPDFVFPKLKAAVFVDGCFWHGCPRHSPPARWLRRSAMPRVARQDAKTPRTGKRFWRDKLAANKARDGRVNRALRAAGWRVVRIWEHQLSECGMRNAERGTLKSEGGRRNAERGTARLVARLRRWIH